MLFFLQNFIAVVIPSLGLFTSIGATILPIMLRLNFELLVH